MNKAFTEELQCAQRALMAAVEEFERKTGRTVDGICLNRIDATNLNDKEPQYVREAYLSWLDTEQEKAEAERLNEAWRAYLDGKGPRPVMP